MDKDTNTCNTNSTSDLQQTVSITEVSGHSPPGPQELKNRQEAPSISEEPPPRISNARRITLLVLFSVAQFMDVCNISALFAAVPKISEQLDLSSSQSVWLISSYQLTFSSFLLLSGRMSDLYNPKHLFNVGFGGLGILSLISGFVEDKIGLIVLRALTGFSAALTIPSALSLIIHLFPEPDEQGRAVTAFLGSGALGSIFGLLIGGIFVQYVTWHWIFFFTSFVAVPIAIICVLLIPSIAAAKKSHLGSRLARAKRLDLVGVPILTIGCILFIFALTQGSNDKWSSAGVLAPLIISVFLIAGFLFYETKIPADKAALPPRVWFYPNFGVLFGLALYPYFWFTAVFFALTSYWQDVIHWSPLITAVHFLPCGFVVVIVMGLLGHLATKYPLKPLILIGGLCMLAANLMLPFADRASRYWSLTFVGFIFAGAGSVFINGSVSIAFFRYSPPSESGIIGAIFNSALQLGSAVGTAVTTSIQSSIDSKQPDPSTSFKGRAAGMWFLLAVLAVEMIAVVVFFKEQKPRPMDEGSEIKRENS